MGYVHDTAMSMIITPAQFQNSAGTWTATNASNAWYLRRTAANATWVTKIPIPLLQNSVALKGSKLVSIDLYYEISTEAMDSVAAVLYKQTAPADGASFPAGTAITTSYDAGHDSAAERYDVDQHKMTLTVTTPEWVDDDDVYYIEVSGDGNTNGLFDWYYARANFTLRV
jgi:hypothetical protein